MITKDSLHKSDEEKVVSEITILLCIVGELAGGESMAVTVGDSDL